MMTRRTDSFVLTLLVAVALMAGCGKGSILPHFGEDGSGLPQALVLADSLMNSRPDSALAVLDGAEEEMAGEPKSVRMRYQLLRHQAMNKAFVPFTSDSLMLDVTDYYDRHGTANDRMLAHYLLGCVYRDMEEAPRAIDCYLDAVAEADTTVAGCDFATLGCIYSQMAWLYHKQLLIANEISARRESAHCSLKANDTLNAIYEQGIMAGSYILLNKKDSAELLLCETMRQYHIQGYDQLYLTISQTLMYLYAEQPDHLLDLKQLIDNFEAESDLFDEHHELPPSKRQFYYYKGKYYETINRLDSAEYYYRKVYRPNMSFTSQTVMYKGLLSIYSKLGLSDSIAKYSQLYCMATDSSIIIRDQQQTAQLTASYDYHYYKNKSLANENRVLWISIVLIVIFNLSFLTIIFLVRLYQRYKVIQERRIAKMSEAYEQAVTKHRQEANRLRDRIAEITEMYRQKQDALHQLDETYNAALANAQSDLAKATAENKTSQLYLKEARQAIEEKEHQYVQSKDNLLEEIADRVL